MMMGCGIVLGTVFDAYRLAVTDFRLPRWTLSCFDAIYWVIATIFVFQALRYSNQAEVRLFVFIGLSVGALVYYIVLSKSVSHGIRFFYKGIMLLYRFLMTILHIFIFTPFMWIYRLLLLIFTMISSLTIFLLKIVIQLLYPFHWLGIKVSKTRSFRATLHMFQRVWKWVTFKTDRDNKED